MNCGRKTYTFSKFRDLSLDVSNYTEPSFSYGRTSSTPTYLSKIILRISDFIEKFFEAEYIDGYKCEGCGQTVKIKKQSHIWEFPNILFMFFKRFEWGYNPQKVRQSISVPGIRIDLLKYCPNNDCKSICFIERSQE